MHNIILITILLITSLDCFSQDVEISNINLKYNEDLSPYMELKFANKEPRTITTIVFGVIYRNIYSGSSYMKNVTVRSNVGSHQTKTLTFSVPNGKYNYKPDEMEVLRVRYSDGTTGGVLDEFERISEENAKKNRSLL